MSTKELRTLFRHRRPGRSGRRHDEKQRGICRISAESRTETSRQRKKNMTGVLGRQQAYKAAFYQRAFSNFIDSLVLGMQTLTYSASFYEDEEAEETKTDAGAG